MMPQGKQDTALTIFERGGALHQLTAEQSVSPRDSKPTAMTI
jgi:hypothetical protein